MSVETVLQRIFITENCNDSGTIMDEGLRSGSLFCRAACLHQLCATSGCVANTSIGPRVVAHRSGSGTNRIGSRWTNLVGASRGVALRHHRSHVQQSPGSWRSRKLCLADACNLYALRVFCSLLGLQAVDQFRQTNPNLQPYFVMPTYHYSLNLA